MPSSQTLNRFFPVQHSTTDGVPFYPPERERFSNTDSTIVDLQGIHAMAMKEKFKFDYYAPYLTADITLIPVCVDEHGRFGLQADSLFQFLARCRGGSRGDTQVFLTYWRRKLAVCSSRAVSNIIRAAMHHLLPPQEQSHLHASAHAAHANHDFSPSG